MSSGDVFFQISLGDYIARFAAQVHTNLACSRRKQGSQMRLGRIIMIKQMVERSQRESDDAIEGEIQRAQKQEKTLGARIWIPRSLAERVANEQDS